MTTDLSMDQTCLPSSWQPTENEIILGRGRRCETHPGNRRFLDIVRSQLSEYSAAKTKALKSKIILRVPEPIVSNSAVGGFVKHGPATGGWLVVTESSAKKIYCAQTFRDQLSEKYKSSKHFKRYRRSQLKKLESAKGIAISDSARVTKIPNPEASPLEHQRSTLEMYSNLRMTLEKANEVIDQDDFSSATQEEHSLSEGSFSSLLHSLAGSVDTSGDPFEPVPIAVSGKSPLSYDRASRQSFSIVSIIENNMEALHDVCSSESPQPLAAKRKKCYAVRNYGNFSWQ